MQHYLISGGSGFIGSALIPELLDAGNQITVLTRNPTKTTKQFQQKVSCIKHCSELADAAKIDVVINLAGQGIADRRWSDAIRQQISDSRLSITRQLVQFMQNTQHRPSVFISGSAIGYYGLRQDETVDESDGGDNSFSSQLCHEWEQEAQAAEALGIRTCYLRTGIVLGKNGGALAKMLPPFKFGLGGPIGNGQQWMAWIHRDDLIGIIRHAITHTSVSGPLNGTAPNPVRNQEFARTLGKALNRPALLPMPGFMVKLLFGEMGKELLLSGQRVLPTAAAQAGYVFKYPVLAPALRAIV